MPVITINRADHTVSIDGAGQKVDCSSLPPFVSVIQWDGNKGWIEFQQAGDGPFMANIQIASVEPYRHLLDKWEEARCAAEEAARQARLKQETIARCQAEANAIVAEMNAHVAEVQNKAGGRKLSTKDATAVNAKSKSFMDRLATANERLKAAIETP